MPRDSTRRALLSTWFAKPTSEPPATDYPTPDPAPARAPDGHESIFAPAPLVPADRTSSYLATRGIHSGEVETEEGAARSSQTRRLRPLAIVLVLVALLAAGWAMPSTVSSTPSDSSGTTILRATPDRAGKSNAPAQRTATPSRHAPAMAGGNATRTYAPAPRSTSIRAQQTDTPVREPTGTPTRAATDTPLPTNTALPTDTPLPTNTPVPIDTPVPPTATSVPPTNTPQPFVRYVVRPGDSLSNIAARFGTTVDAIVRTNGLASTTIFAGQSLIIPLDGRR